MASNEDIDPLTVTAEGDGLVKGETGKKCHFTVIGAPNVEGLTLSAEGPSCKPDVMIASNVSNETNSNFDEEEGSGQSSGQTTEKKGDSSKINASFVPLIPGAYKITIRWKGRQIKGSPFKMNVSGEKVDVSALMSKVKIHGRALELGKAYAINEILVDTSRMETVIGGLKVHISGPQRSAAQLKIQDNRNGTFRIRYKPTSPGMYTLNMKIADHHVPGSPFTIRVTEFLSS